MPSGAEESPSEVPGPSGPVVDPVVEHVACPLCGADRARPYRAAMYRIERVRFDLVRCPCGMVYVNPRPDGATLGRMYDDPDYYTEGYNLGVETENYFDRKDELLTLYDAAVAEIEAEVGLRGGELLELGSAGGFFIEAARRRGWSVRGIELSPPAAEYSRRELGLEVFEGLLEDAPFEPASFDVCLADNVLEHTQRPDRVLRDLRALLRPGGHLVVIVPSYVNSIWFRALLALQRWVPRRLLGEPLQRILKLDPRADERGDERGGGYPYHILEFDRATLTRLLGEAGFEIRAVEASVPLPAHLFKNASPTLRERLLKGVFTALDRAMRLGLVPGARLRVLARRPRD